MKKLLDNKRLLFKGIYILASVILVCSGSVYPQKLTASSGTAEEFFGSAVSLSGEFAFVGAPYDASHGNLTGAVYIYRFDGYNWNEVENLKGSNVFDQFGVSLSADNGYAVIGAPGHEGKGAAFIYRWDGNDWKQEAELKASDGMTNDWFGSAVSIKKNVAVISATNDFLGTGIIYIFEKEGSSWVEKTSITSPAASSADYFGFAVELNENATEFIAGSRGAAYSGNVHVYQRASNSWVRTADLKIKYPIVKDYFGSGVDINGDLAVVGARLDKSIGPDEGSVYVFRRSGKNWKCEAKLIACDGVEGDRFGEAVILNNKTIIIGASHNDDDGLDAGCVYIFQWSGTEWITTGKIHAPDGSPGKGFGIKLSADNNRILIGAPYDNDKGANAGAAYMTNINLQTGSLQVLLRGTFDEQDFPPAGWTRKTFNKSATWESGAENGIASFSMFDPASKYSAVCPWSVNKQDEWLITPKFDLPAGKVNLRFFTGYASSDIANANLSVSISGDGGESWKKLWETEDDGAGVAWRERIISLNQYSGKTALILAFRYQGKNGNVILLDGIVIYSMAVAVHVEKNKERTLPGRYLLLQNYPNPFNAQTRITFEIPVGSFIELNIYDLLGRKVDNLIDKFMEAGIYEVTLNGDKLPSGTYIYCLRSEANYLAKKMTLLK
ncbi:MAG: choice-of-anchor J domain-containing protein [Bacillota bacterium]